MGKNAECSALTRVKRKEYREQHLQEEKDSREQKLKLVKAGDYRILDVIFKAGDVDMESFCGTELELAYAIEELYANDGRDFDPTLKYRPSMLSSFGKNYAMHARGIYYRDIFTEDWVVGTRKVWTPSFLKNESQSPELLDRQARAKTFANRSKNNEKWCKSEYAWEADAWSNVFPHMRDDPCLEIDKREYMTLLADIDPITCHLTGTSTMVSRTPDATFGLATFSDGDAMLPAWTSELHRERLERLMLHPKYGLISDPKRLDIGLSFPFMVYEAKGWSGDCRVARQQACSAAAVYLDMLDDLARRPGQLGSPRPYQTSTSHCYQVFALTSFGAYWHLLVGYRRPRQSTEHADAHGMSETVYIFRNIWSGRVTDEYRAAQLLSLIDQIHVWAITEFRSFVLEHLQPWHQICEENYLLEWNSKYDIPGQKKRKRACIDTEDLMVPDWVADMPESSRRLFQARAKDSLEEAVRNSSLIKGKFQYQEEIDMRWLCIMEGCKCIGDSEATMLGHLREAHDYGDRELAQARSGIHDDKSKREIRARLKRGGMATGHRWPGGPLPFPFQEHELTPGCQYFLSNNPAKRRKIPIPEERDDCD